ncbi:MAG TPA: hypothetical protein VL463_32490, partial [Kofleriaceae bacterium]|nr:hypothetical protein [Kofleriaceae bacterium]
MRLVLAVLLLSASVVHAKPVGHEPFIGTLSVHGPRDRDAASKEIDATWAPKWFACLKAMPAGQLWTVTFKLDKDGVMSIGDTHGTWTPKASVKTCLKKTLTAPFAGKTDAPTELV